MAGRVHQVEDVILAVLGAVVQPHRLRLDGDAALALDIHGIEHLLLARHFAVRQPARHLDQAVGQRRFAMVDMGDDGEVADVGNGGGCHGARDSIHTPVRQPYCCILRGFLHAKLIPLDPKTRYARGHVDCIHFAHGRARQAHSHDPAARGMAGLARQRSQSRPVAGHRLCRGSRGPVDADSGQSEDRAGRPYGRRRSLRLGAEVPARLWQAPAAVGMGRRRLVHALSGHRLGDLCAGDGDARLAGS